MKQEPLSDAELTRFEDFAWGNQHEPDGSQSQWADYTLRLITELRERRKQDAARWPPRDVVEKTLEATRHLLADHDCDHDQCDVWQAAYDVGIEWLHALTPEGKDDAK